MNFLLTLLLVVVGLLLLLLSLAGVAFGVFMALDERNRERGVFFAVWLVPAVAASLGIILRDGVTFVIGAVCFVVAGVALALEHRLSRRQAKSSRRTGPATAKAGANKKPLLPERAKRSFQVGTEQLLETSRRWFSERARTRK